MPSQPIYKVIFHNGGQVYEVFVRQIYQSDMWGFVEIEELVFGERSQIVVDPGEEKLKNEFASSPIGPDDTSVKLIVKVDVLVKSLWMNFTGTGVSNVTFVLSLSIGEPSAKVRPVTFLPKSSGIPLTSL